MVQKYNYFADNKGYEAKKFPCNRNVILLKRFFQPF